MSAILSRIRVRVVWTEWFVGVWWWPVRKDLAFGIMFGPLSIHWERGNTR